MSFITNYLKTCEGTEPPTEYHIWSMLSTLSTFAGRRFWFPFGPLRFYPNLYVVLVGDPGMRKSTAMNRAKNIVRMADVCPIAPTQTTKESMSKEMTHEKFKGKKYFTYNGHVEEYNQYTIYATELTQFLGVNPLGFLDFLTTVWDEPVYEVKTKNQGNDYVMGPYITMLACMTPQMVKGYLKMNILTGGFARRTAFILASDRKIVDIPEETAEQVAAKQWCAEFGKRVQTRFGPYGWTDELKEYYCAWNQANQKTIKDKHPSTHGWYESKAEMLFKISMLVALGEDEGQDLTLRLPHYKMAMRFCGYVEKNLERVFEGTGINPDSGAASQICRMLESMDRPMNKKHIEAMFFDQSTSLNALRDTIQHLVSVGRLAEKAISVNGSLLGTVIGTPQTVAAYSDVELATFLARGVALPPSLDTDSSPEVRPPTPPIEPPVG